jgi:hypothetical protein
MECTTCTFLCQIVYLISGFEKSEGVGWCFYGSAPGNRIFLLHFATYVHGFPWRHCLALAALFAFMFCSYNLTSLLYCCSLGVCSRCVRQGGMVSDRTDGRRHALGLVQSLVIYPPLAFANVSDCAWQNRLTFVARIFLCHCRRRSCVVYSERDRRETI